MNTYYYFLIFTFCATALVAFLLERSGKIKINIDPYVFIPIGLLSAVLIGDILAAAYLCGVSANYLAWTFIWIAIIVQGLFLIGLLLSWIPMPNKKMIMISHFFGFMKDKEPIDRVTVNVSSTFYSEEENRVIQFEDDDKLPYYLAASLKERIYSILEEDPELEKRCRKVFQVWVTFYKSLSKEDLKHSSIMKMCYYREGVLYYPCKTDRALWKEKKQQWDIEDQKKVK